jgi:hypothetical protein
MKDVDLSYYSAIRVTASSAAAYAGRLEKGGRTEEGYRERSDLMTVGDLIRQNASTVTGTLCGIAVTGASATHLFGSIETKERFSLPQMPERRVALDRYLRTVGHASDIPRVQALADVARRTPRLLFSDGFDVVNASFRFHAWLLAAYLLWVPAAWLGLMGILAGGWRIPSANAGWSRKFGALALPAACVALILYGLASLQTLSVASHINKDLMDIVQHEGRYYARQAGQEWPR